MITQIKTSHSSAVKRIYNHYVNNSAFTFSGQEMSDEEAAELVAYGIKYAGFIIKDKKAIVGFGIAYPFRHEILFRHTIKLTYFLSPGYTGKGYGSELFTRLHNELQKKGYKNILVNISSLNKASIRFHKKLGFKKCGDFKDIGSIDQQKISMIWMQKEI
ncbi:GNAT family N-acetyltransferase [Chitinophaga flava]|uniref:N-acetyltransferase domain-containing protein n=1 Tax=Chitinophaga flava TaxID=2259036 RepID=A0A365XUL7_9BACT|nr:GNAT family N-acetyltransferase [Chitinophaga flava]RBL90052.1 hypothetical protein DF182_26640 [Chitinophaga flava]